MKNKLDARSTNSVLLRRAHLTPCTSVHSSRNELPSRTNFNFQRIQHTVSQLVHCTYSLSIDPARMTMNMCIVFVAFTLACRFFCWFVLIKVSSVYFFLKSYCVIPALNGTESLSSCCEQIFLQRPGIFFL